MHLQKPQTEVGAKRNLPIALPVQPPPQRRAGRVTEELQQRQEQAELAVKNSDNEILLVLQRHVSTAKHRVPRKTQPGSERESGHV